MQRSYLQQLAEDAAELLALSGCQRREALAIRVPIAPLATLLVWVVAFLNRDRRLGATSAKASLFGALAMGVNVLIVTTLISKLFGSDYQAHASQLHSYATCWNVLNVVRMGLVATTAIYVFGAFRELDRVRPTHTRPIRGWIDDG